MIKNYRYFFISLFVFIIYLLCFFQGLFVHIDQVVSLFFVGIRSDILTVIMKMITFIGSWQGVTIICLLVIALEKKKGLFLSICAIFGHLANSVIKNIVQRSRPFVEHLVKETSYSFPSGHSMVSMTVFLLLAMMLWNKNKKYSFLAITFPLIIGVTRMYLGVHYLSDVIGGFIFANVFVSIALILKNKISCD